MDLSYRLAFLGGLLGLMVAARLFARRYGKPANDVPRSADGPVLGRALALSGLLLWGGMLAWVVWAPALGWSAMGLPAAARWAGLPLFLAGGGLAMWARFTLGQSSTTTGVPGPDSVLVTGGPYRWFRHPIYSGGAVTVSGAVLLADSGFVLAVSALALGLLAYRTRREERLLLDRYGDAYRAHMARTGRWLPRLRARR